MSCQAVQRSQGYRRIWTKGQLQNESKEIRKLQAKLLYCLELTSTIDAAQFRFTTQRARSSLESQLRFEHACFFAGFLVIEACSQWDLAEVAVATERPNFRKHWIHRASHCATSNAFFTSRKDNRDGRTNSKLLVIIRHVIRIHATGMS